MLLALLLGAPGAARVSGAASSGSAAANSVARASEGTGTAAAIVRRCV